MSASGSSSLELSSGFGVTSSTIVNQYGLLDTNSAMDVIENLNKKIDNRNDLRTV